MMRLRRLNWADLLAPTWTIVLALVVIWDVWTCWSVLNDGWTEGRKQTIEFVNFEDLFRATSPQGNDDTCPVGDTDLATCVPPLSPFRISPGLLFCCLCIVESIVRAKEARQIALENEALDMFEKKLAKLYNATRCSVFRQQPGKDDYQDDLALARNTVRIWTPVASILLGWFILLPWTSFFQGYECGHDPSLATLWITQLLSQICQALTGVREKAMNFLWRKLARPYIRVFHKPILLVQRLRLLARWIRYIRFAGPLVRILLKLQSQLAVFTQTWKQALNVQAEKAKRVARRSMLFSDIQRIESLTKVQTALASLPSQLFHIVQGQASGIGTIIARKKEEGRKLQRRLEVLKNDLHQNTRIIPSSEIYDRMVELTQELTKTVHTAFWNAHLISPHTRFSVGWRVIVSGALLSELVRLYVSWQLSGTFDIRYTDMTRRLLVECQQKSNPIRQWIRRLWNLPPAVRILDTCHPTSVSSRVCLHIARASEISIDLVCFLDIFVWFFTGELNEQGVVIPKHWFPRCILPGALIQVLDHPTVPEKLPLLFSYAFNAIRAVGYGRVIRWGLAIFPAIEMVVIAPLKSYLFRPMDEDEYNSYTESLGFMQSFSSTAMLYPLQDSSMESHPSEMLHLNGDITSSIRSDWSRGSGMVHPSLRTIPSGEFDWTGGDWHY